MAEHPSKGTYLVEVEGQSARQKEQALYSALGQLLLQCHGGHERLLLAVPDSAEWERQTRKIPAFSRKCLRLSIALASAETVREV